MTALDRLASLGFALPDVPAPVANYVPGKRVGDLLFISGQGPLKDDGTGTFHLGTVGDDVSVEQAYVHARLAGLSLLAVARSLCGDLDKLEAVKILGMVNAVPQFGQQPQVINGCSDLFVAVLGERGRHARSAVGMGSLPGNMTVEIEAIFRVHE